MQALIDTIERITRLFGMIAAWLIVPLAGSMMWEVISRYVFSRPTIWAYEIAYMQMGALFVLGIALTTQAKAHVRVDLLYDIFSPRWKAVVDLVGFLLLAVMILWLCYGLWGYLEDGWISGERSGKYLESGGLACTIVIFCRLHPICFANLGRGSQILAPTFP